MNSPTISWMAAAPRNITMTRAEKNGVGGIKMAPVFLSISALLAAVTALVQAGPVA